MKNPICTVLPAPIASAARNLLTFINRESLSTPEEFMEEDGFGNVSRHEKYNTEEFKDEEFFLMKCEKEDFDKIFPFLDDWYDINNYPETYKAENESKLECN